MSDADYELVMGPRAMVHQIRATTPTEAPEQWVRDLWRIMRGQLAPPLMPGDMVRSAKAGNDVVGMREGVPWRITAIDEHNVALLRAEHPSLGDAPRYSHAAVSVLERWQP